MAKKKKIEEEKEFEKQLAEVEFPECDGGQSTRENEMIEKKKGALVKESSLNCSFHCCASLMTDVTMKDRV